MPIVQPLRVLDIDGQKQLVEEMSPEVQQLVAVYNEWNQDLVDARTKFAQLQVAVNGAHEQISEQIKKEFAAQAEAEQAKQDAATAEAMTAAATDGETADLVVPITE